MDEVFFRREQAEFSLIAGTKKGGPQAARSKHFL